MKKNGNCSNIHYLHRLIWIELLVDQYSIENMLQIWWTVNERKKTNVWEQRVLQTHRINSNNLHIIDFQFIDFFSSFVHFFEWKFVVFVWVFFVRWSCRLKSRLLSCSICFESVWLEYDALRLAIQLLFGFMFEEEFREHSEKELNMRTIYTFNRSMFVHVCVQIIRVSAFDETRNTIQCKFCDELKMSLANIRMNHF